MQVAVVRHAFLALEGIQFASVFALMPLAAAPFLSSVGLVAALVLGFGLLAATWFVMRKPTALLKGLLLRRLAARATRRANGGFDGSLDVVTRGGSSVGVPAGVAEPVADVVVSPQKR